MPKNILIFSDGTGQAGGQKPDQKLSNIYKLYRATRSGPESPISPNDQVAFYDPGLGAEEIDGPIWKRPMKFVRKHLSSATGKGFSRNVVDCYEAILKLYEPGDQIFLFGFSRGAYTVRSVGGVMSLCGVPYQDTDGKPLPKYGPRLRKIATEAVKEVYEHGAGRPIGKYKDERNEKARRFRANYSINECPEPRECGNVVPYFIGVFDTVAALGTHGLRRFLMYLLYAIIGLSLSAGIAVVFQWVYNFIPGLPNVCFIKSWAIIAIIIVCLSGCAYVKSHYRVIRDWPKKGQKRGHFVGWRFAHYDKFLNKNVRYGRHALAIDETRKDFNYVEWAIKDEDKRPEADWLKHFWFSGNHSDIGGSYPELESRLSDIALKWMVDEASTIPNPILMDKSRLYAYPNSSAMQHCEVVATRNKIPKWLPKFLHFTWKEKVRSNVSIAGCHPTVLERIALPSIQKLDKTIPYRPAALNHDSAFLKLIEND